MYMYHQKSRPTVARMACVIVGVSLGILILARLTAPSLNPFDRPLSGDLLSWDAGQSRGLATIDGRTVWLRLDGSAVGEPPATGCHVRAQGVTWERSEQRVPALVAAVLIVENCPIRDSAVSSEARS